MRGLIPKLPRSAWVVLAGDAVSAIGSGLTLPFLLIYLHVVRGLPLTVAGMAVATIAFASLVGNPIGGSLSDRMGSRNTLILGLVLTAAGTAAATLVREGWHAFAMAALIGLGASISWPAQDALLATLVDPKHRSSVFSVRHATMNAGLGLGALLAAVIVDTSRPGTFVAVYLVDAVSYLLFIPILLSLGAVGRAVVHAEGVKRAGYRVVIGDRIFRRVWLLTVLAITVGYGQYHAAFPGYATRPGGISVRALGLVFAANTIAVVVFQLPALKLLGGRRRSTGMAFMFGFWAVAWAVTLVAGALGGGLWAILTFALAMVVFAVGETLLSPTLPAIVNDLAPDALRGHYNGISVLAWTTGFMIGPVVAGFALSRGLGSAMFVGLIVLCGLGSVAAQRLGRRLPTDVDRIPEGAAELTASAATKGELQPLCGQI
jgi:MFS family permease